MNVIVCIPNPIANKMNSHFRGKMEILARAASFATGEEVIVSTSQNQWDLMNSDSVNRTYIHLGDSYGGPEIGGWNWNEYGRMSEDPDTYNGWISDVRRCWNAVLNCKNPEALEFPFPNKFKFMASSTLRRPEWVGTPELELFEMACKKLTDFSIIGETKTYFSPWSKCYELGWNSFVLGDSHSSSVWRPGLIHVYRKGETLHGAIKRGFSSILVDTVGRTKWKHGVFNYGNIDLRHHVCRFPNTEEVVRKLVDGYESEIIKCNLDEVTVAQLFPNTSDSRVLSKSVMYRQKVLNKKGKEVAGDLTPFSGSLEQRNQAYRYFDEFLRDMCRRNSWKYHEWPEFFKDRLGQFNPVVMEGGNPNSIGGRGIHLSPLFYYWDFQQNRVNQYEQYSQPDMENFFT